jgi:hypothetical protein
MSSNGNERETNMNDNNDMQGTPERQYLQPGEEFSGGGFIKADDVAETGPEKVTVEAVRWADFADGRKPVLIFTDGRELSLGKTRANQLKALAGGKLTLETVKGLSLTLTAEKVKGQNGRMVNSIQIGKGEGF